MGDSSPVGVIVNPTKTRVFDRVEEILYWLKKQNVTIHAHRETEVLQTRHVDRFFDDPGELHESVELVLVFGGDGTLLNAAKTASHSETPLLGVNSGGLGFMTETTLDEVEQILPAVLDGDFELDRRMMISGYAPEKTDAAHLHALNDLVLSRTKLGRVVTIRASVDGDFVTEYVCDGVIISTPTGSTAYNLSSQGPIIHPDHVGIILNPICPHTLTNRPLILPDDVSIQLEVASDDECILTADGQSNLTELTRGDNVEVEKSDRTVSLIHPEDRTFYEILRSKLQWGGAT